MFYQKWNIILGILSEYLSKYNFVQFSLIITYAATFCQSIENQKACLFDAPPKSLFTIRPPMVLQREEFLSALGGKLGRCFISEQIGKLHLSQLSPLPCGPWCRLSFYITFTSHHVAGSCRSRLFTNVQYVVLSSLSADVCTGKASHFLWNRFSLLTFCCTTIKGLDKITAQVRRFTLNRYLIWLLLKFIENVKTLVTLEQLRCNSQLLLRAVRWKHTQRCIRCCWFYSRFSHLCLFILPAFSNLQDFVAS